MLTRVYIDNFRCFEDFEFRPQSHQLILGGNGSGKSSFMDALLLLRRFAVEGDNSGSLFSQVTVTRWRKPSSQLFEMEVHLDGEEYLYRLLTRSALVLSEAVELNRQTLFRFAGGEVHTYNDQFELKGKYELDPNRSALASMASRPDNVKLIRFREWFSELLGFRMNPFAMGARSETADATPRTDLSNIAAWYRHLRQGDEQANTALCSSLRESLDGLDVLRAVDAGLNVEILSAVFHHATFHFGELSEGQRCLIGLYMILHFLVAKGRTVIIDEPENFISLREIQPWLMAAADAVEDAGGQLLLVSHHPELINQWAPDFGVQFIRENGGAARVQRFQGDPGSELSPSERIARGWE